MPGAGAISAVGGDCGWNILVQEFWVTGGWKEAWELLDLPAWASCARWGMAISLDAMQGLTASNGQVRDWIQSFAPLTTDYASSCLLPLRSPPYTFMWPFCVGTRHVFPRVTIGRVSGGGVGYSAEDTEVVASAGQVLGTHLLYWQTSAACSICVLSSVESPLYSEGWGV